MDKVKVDFCCAECGSYDVTRTMAWDVETQEWLPIEEPSAFCGNCVEVVGLMDYPIDEVLASKTESRILGEWIIDNEEYEAQSERIIEQCMPTPMSDPKVKKAIAKLIYGGKK